MSHLDLWTGSSPARTRARRTRSARAASDSMTGWFRWPPGANRTATRAGCRGAGAGRGRGRRSGSRASGCWRGQDLRYRGRAASDLFHVWLKRVLPDIEPDLFGPKAVRAKDGLQNKNDEIMVRRVHEPGRRTPPSRWSRPRRTSAVPSSRRSADPTPTKSSTATAKPLPSRRSMPGFGIPGQNRATCSGHGQSAIARPARSAGLWRCESRG